MKLVLIGAGSYVFAPTVLDDLLFHHGIVQSELVLVDLNAGAAQAMAGAGRRLAEDAGGSCTVSWTTDRREALPGADFVILSASPEGMRRWSMDYEILKRHGIPDQARECGGLGGLCNSFRSISLALAVCRDIEALCPKAILLDVTNPMPRVVTAVRRATSIAAFGFCNAAQRGPSGYEWAAGLLGTTAADIDVVSAGLNHFSWILSARTKSGEDLLPILITAVRQGSGWDSTLQRKWLDAYGAVAACNPHHVSEFLPFDPDAHYQTKPPYHGAPDERARQYAQLLELARREVDWRPKEIHLTWEHPVDVAVALKTGGKLTVPMLNLPNEGYLSGLPDKRIVEVPALVSDGKVHGVRIGALPSGAERICSAVSDVHEKAAEAAMSGSRAMAMEAVEMDPAVTDKNVAREALAEMLAAHRDMLPQFT